MTAGQSNWNDSLYRLRAQRAAIGHHPKLGAMACGWKEGDEKLLSLGRECLAFGPQKPAASAQGPDVFIATALYRIGGHTALIGDLVRALAQISPETSPRLIVTNANEEHTGALTPEIIARTAVDPDKIDMLPGPEAADRLEQLLARLCELRPRRLFLFQHPDDPVACAGVQRKIGGETFLVHHADSVPTFGLHVPGIRVVDLTPGAAAMSRAQGLDAALLLLTAPDPGPRPITFLQRGKLVTASSGIGHKFKSQHRYTYADAVGVILRTTRGWHVHIGPLDDSQLSEIRESLRKDRVGAEQFIHVPYARSLAASLWEHGCDLYFSSFPVGGARTNAEVSASATPHLRFSGRPLELPETDPLRLGGGLVWRTWEELESTLKSVANEKALNDRSKAVRVDYEKFYHPRVFAERLRDILQGGPGWNDSYSNEREAFAIKRMSDILSDHSEGSTTEFSNERFQNFVNSVAESK
jgi:hypothetical protein